MIYEYWLEGSGHSKRAVRYRMLSPNEVDMIAKEAAMGGAGMTGVEYYSKYTGIGVRRMITAYTEPLGYTPVPPNENGEAQPDAPPDLDDASMWKPADPTALEMSFGNGNIFTAKDKALLEIFFKGIHEVNMLEAQAAMGKVRSREK